MFAIPVERFFNHGYSLMEVCLNGQPPVVGNAFVPSVDAVKEATREELAVSGYVGGEEQTFKVALRPADVVSMPGVDRVEAAIAIDERGRAEGGHFLFYIVFIPNVVLVAQGDVIARGALHGRHEVAVPPHVLRIDEEVNARVAPGVFPHNVASGVGGAVVLHNQFAERIGLTQERVDLFSDETRSVIGDHDNRNGGRGSGSCCHFFCFKIAR